MLATKFVQNKSFKSVIQLLFSVETDINILNNCLLANREKSIVKIMKLKFMVDIYQIIANDYFKDNI